MQISRVRIVACALVVVLTLCAASPAAAQSVSRGAKSPAAAAVASRAPETSAPQGGAAAPARDGSAVARSFRELEGRIEPGDTVYVTREAGERTRATVQGFDADLSTLFFNAGGTSFGLSETQLRQLELRYGDSLVNGAVIGAVAGGGLFVVAGIICAAVDSCTAASETFAAAALMGGIGAGIGVGIDAAVKTERLVYVSPSPRPGGLALVPVIDGTRRGAVVVLRF